MKKNIGLVLFLAFVLLAPDSFGRRRPAQPLEFKKISDRLYEIVGGQGSRGGAYIGDDGVLVIDAKGDKKSVDLVIEGIKKIADKPIKYPWKDLSLYILTRTAIPSSMSRRSPGCWRHWTPRSSAAVTVK